MTSGAFKSLCSEQNGDVSFLQKKKKKEKKNNKENALGLLFFYVFI